MERFDGIDQQKYNRGLSAPNGHHYHNHSPHNPRSPSNTMPVHVPDSIITAGTATLPMTTRIRQQGQRSDQNGCLTLDRRIIGLDIAGMKSPGDWHSDDEFVWELYKGDEERIRERDILMGNRAKLCEYIHDCTVLFPYMREKKIFNQNDCIKIRSEITLKMDTFIDIVLTKGPHAIGVFHESLDRHYPAVFDVLSRLFTNAGIILSVNRRLKDRTDEDENTTSVGDVDVRSWQRKRSSRHRDGIKTIRHRLKDLSDHCALVQRERDELQSTLNSREKDINALINRIGHQDTRMQQIEELVSLLRNWKDVFTDQSHGSIQKLNEIIKEKESIQAEYIKLSGELELSESELMAASDRISKLLNHLEMTDKQATVSTEKLNEEIQKKAGEIEKLNRKITRLTEYHTPEELELQLLQANDEKDCLQEQLMVASRERKYAIDSMDKALSKVYNYKRNNKTLREKVMSLKSSIADSGSQRSTPLTSSDFIQLTDPLNHTEDIAIHASTEAVSDIDLGMSVVVRGISEHSKAIENGLKIGDELREVNNCKVTPDCCKDPLEFARQIMNSFSKPEVTFLIRRQATPTQQCRARGYPGSVGLIGVDTELPLKNVLVKQLGKNVPSPFDPFGQPGMPFTTQDSSNSKVSSSASLSTKSHDDLSSSK